PRVGRWSQAASADRGDCVVAVGEGLLAGGSGWWDLRLWRCRLLRLDRWDASEPADRRHGVVALGERLLAGGCGWWCLRLRRRLVPRVHGRHGAAATGGEHRRLAGRPTTGRGDCPAVGGRAVRYP